MGAAVSTARPERAEAKRRRCRRTLRELLQEENRAGFHDCEPLASIFGGRSQNSPEPHNILVYIADQTSMIYAGRVGGVGRRSVLSATLMLAAACDREANGELKTLTGDLLPRTEVVLDDVSPTVTHDLRVCADGDREAVDYFVTVEIAVKTPDADVTASLGEAGDASEEGLYDVSEIRGGSMEIGLGELLVFRQTLELPFCEFWALTFVGDPMGSQIEITYDAILGVSWPGHGGHVDVGLDRVP